MILGRKVRNLRLIISEDIFFREHYFSATKVKKPEKDSKLRPFFFIENTRQIFFLLMNILICHFRNMVCLCNVDNDKVLEQIQKFQFKYSRIQIELPKHKTY